MSEFSVQSLCFGIGGNNAFWKIGLRVTAPRSARLKAGLEYVLLLT
jgi:hypothetical protein